MESPLTSSNSSLLSDELDSPNAQTPPPRRIPDFPEFRFDRNFDSDSSEDELLGSLPPPLPPRRNAVLVTGQLGRPRIDNPRMPPIGRISGNRQSMESLQSAMGKSKCVQSGIKRAKYILGRKGVKHVKHLDAMRQRVEFRFGPGRGHFSMNDSAEFGRLMDHVMQHSADHVPGHIGAGLSTVQLNQLPISDVTVGQLDKTCTICMDNYELGSKIRMLPCFHFFHRDCVDPWLKRNRECPVCRVSAKPE